MAYRYHAYPPRSHLPRYILSDVWRWHCQEHEVGGNLVCDSLTNCPAPIAFFALDGEAHIKVTPERVHIGHLAEKRELADVAKSHRLDEPDDCLSDLLLAYPHARSSPVEIRNVTTWPQTRVAIAAIVPAQNTMR